MTTILVDVNAETFSAYAATPADVIAMITRAYNHCSPIVDESQGLEVVAGTTVGNADLELVNSNEQEAVTMLTIVLLINARKHQKGRSQDITPQSIDKLMTEEIRDMLVKGEAPTQAKIYPDQAAKGDWRG